jgi:hypothetical protein
MTAKQLLTEANLHATHWGQRIIRAEETGAFTGRDASESGEWTTCACGKQDPRIPRYYDGEPHDGGLMLYGMRFVDYVSANQYTEAADTLIAIEHRAAELLAELPA